MSDKHTGGVKIAILYLNRNLQLNFLNLGAWDRIDPVSSNSQSKITIFENDFIFCVSVKLKKKWKIKHENDVQMYITPTLLRLIEI